jgi:hypothetical protein
LFKTCLSKLIEFEEEVWKVRSTSTLDGGLHSKKPEVQFFLKKKSRESFEPKSHTGARRLCRKKINSATNHFKDCFRAVGTLVNNSTVSYTLPSGETIRIRMDNSRFYGDEEDSWNYQKLHKVTYVIGLSFAGPVAYDVQTLQRSMISKIQQIQSDESSTVSST